MLLLGDIVRGHVRDRGGRLALVVERLRARPAGHDKPLADRFVRGW